MAGHIQDRWYKTVPDPDGGKPQRVKTERHGHGSRYRARYVGPDGTERSKAFPDRRKREAELWLSQVEADMAGGHHHEPNAGRETFGRYAEKWLASQTTDPTTRESVVSQIKGHAIPYLGSRPLGSFKPEHVRAWLAELEQKVPASSYRRVIYNSVSSILNAAVDDGHLRRNPCHARSVRPPERGVGRVIPWSTERTFAVRAALPRQYQAALDLGAGCGLRQGEIFGLPEEEVRFDTGWVHVAQQVKLVGGRLVFAPPKRNKARDVPLPASVAAALKRHREDFPPVAVTLPWGRPDGRPVTKLLLFRSLDGSGAVRRTDFNDRVWKPALASAGVIEEREPDRRRYPAAREHGMHALRHFYASVLLDAGENVKALSHYLGHTDPGFTLRVYTHLMPSSDGRARRAVDALYGTAQDGPAAGSAANSHGPETAQGR
ncbi:tyrosine-type recombinase/integrase [Streptomyces sp. NPDC056600]|uniref:tyrosine-type recombinase/integrase n=1 Tax=Streptomyces sp. NPDC056600 TaxID=3345874 RepID=UPI00369C8B0A